MILPFSRRSNVPNLLLMEKGHFRDAILAHLKSVGYKNTTFVKVSAADFGVPQARERVFFFGTPDDIGFKLDLKEYAESMLKKIRVTKPVVVRDAIRDLPASVVHSGQTMTYPELPDNASQFLKKMRLDASGGAYTKAIKRWRAIGKLL
jgi:DNA (cytosine-5)-methyltransferase 1